MCLTFEMRNNLLQYGDILFLDAQNRPINKIGWPYIGISIKTNENKIGVTSKSVVLIIYMNMCQWVMDDQSEMEQDGL